MISSPERAGVLITRPQSMAEQTAREVRALGYRPVIAPLFSVQPLQAALPVAETLQAVLITSGHALAALPPLFAGWRCLRSATRRRHARSVRATGTWKAPRATPKASPRLPPAAAIRMDFRSCCRQE